MAADWTKRISNCFARHGHRHDKGYRKGRCAGMPACPAEVRTFGTNWREPGLKLLYLRLPELECPGCQGRQTSMWVLHGQGWLCRALVPSRLGPFWGRFPTSRAPDW
jgi:hypothetical protein